MRASWAFPRDRAERQRLGRRVRSLASTPPPAGTNTVLVTHGATAAAAFGVTPAEGETLVVQPGGDGTPELVRRVPANAWLAMAGDGQSVAKVAPRVRTYRVGARQPVDVAPARSGLVWWADAASGQVGRFDPRSGRDRTVRLGAGASPEAVMLGPDGAPWVADAGRNALLRIDPRTLAVRAWSLPAGRPGVGLASLTFDRSGTLWFTGRRGVIGRLEPGSGSIEVFDAPAGSAPDAISTTPRGEVFYVATSAGHLARVDLETGAAEALEPPTPGPLGGPPQTPADGCGSPSRAAGRSPCTTRPPAAGANGACPGRAARPSRRASGWTPAARCGSATRPAAP